MAEMKQIVRINYSDILGNKKVTNALRSVFGVNHNFSAAICNSLDIDHTRKIGTLSNDEVKKIEDMMRNPLQFKIPVHMVNRRRDPETGKDLHLTVSNLKLSREFDVKSLKKIKSYRGIRHALGLPLRGQRTRSNFRRGKAVGVSKKKAKTATGKK